LWSCGLHSLPRTPSSHVLLMPSLKHLTHGISNLVSLITKTKLGLSGEHKMSRASAPVGHRELHRWSVHYARCFFYQKLRWQADKSSSNRLGKCIWEAIYSYCAPKTHSNSLSILFSIFPSRLFHYSRCPYFPSESCLLSVFSNLTRLL
jgi:hypothetical protein